MNLLNKKRGLIIGVANERSAAWGIAKYAFENGADLAFTYQLDTFKKRVEPLAKSLNSEILIECDVSKDGSIKNAFEHLKYFWNNIDFVVHSIGFSEKSELQGPFYNTSKKNFLDTMVVSAFSFTEIAHESKDFIKKGGALLTLTYLGGVRTTPNYNVMGLAKAALEASTRYLAVDLGKKNIRVNALSAGPMKTLAGSAIKGARHIYRHSELNAPLGRNPDVNEVAKSAVYLVSDFASGVTGKTHYVDGGYNSVGVPNEENN